MRAENASPKNSDASSVVGIYLLDKLLRGMQVSSRQRAHARPRESCESRWNAIHVELMEAAHRADVAEVRQHCDDILLAALQRRQATLKKSRAIRIAQVALHWPADASAFVVLSQRARQEVRTWLIAEAPRAARNATATVRTEYFNMVL